MCKEAAARENSARYEKRADDILLTNGSQSLFHFFTFSTIDINQGTIVNREDWWTHGRSANGVRKSGVGEPAQSDSSKSTRIREGKGPIECKRVRREFNTSGENLSRPPKTWSRRSLI